MDNKIRKSLSGLLSNWIIPVLIAVVIAVLINKFVIFKVKIPSESMVPTLNVGDNLFARRVYNPENLKRGDLVIFYSQEREQLMIKRLIGLPNDDISINNGVVSVNSEILTEDYVENQEEFSGKYKVPQGKYFFLGDNRANSGDSRYWKNSYIDSTDIKGKAIIKVYPFDDIGFVE